MSDLRGWWAQEQKRRERYFAEQSAEFFAAVEDDDDTVPDLEFNTPFCSICTRPTDFDDGQFYCETCNVGWPSSGYGSDASVYDADGNLVPLASRRKANP